MIFDFVTSQSVLVNQLTYCKYPVNVNDVYSIDFFFLLHKLDFVHYLEYTNVVIVAEGLYDIDFNMYIYKYTYTVYICVCVYTLCIYVDVFLYVYM